MEYYQVLGEYGYQKGFEEEEEDENSLYYHKSSTQIILYSPKSQTFNQVFYHETEVYQVKTRRSTTLEFKYDDRLGLELPHIVIICNSPCTIINNYHFTQSFGKKRKPTDKERV